MSARAIITLHAIETIENCLQQLLQITETDGLSAVKKNQPDPESTAPNTRSMQLSGTATGWIDSPRGILAHTYTADEGIITNAQIITPTAQNEPWLGKLLTAAVQQADVHQREEALEESIRSADPCLPVSSAPKGHMSLRIEEKLQPPE
ncbi:nickel-dependent hydrogenase large subunit [Arcanobacterium hippocoleae]